MYYGMIWYVVAVTLWHSIDIWHCPKSLLIKIVAYCSYILHNLTTKRLTSEIICKTIINYNFHNVFISIILYLQAKGSLCEVLCNILTLPPTIVKWITVDLKMKVLLQNPTKFSDHMFCAGLAAAVGLYS